MHDFAGRVAIITGGGGGIGGSIASALAKEGVRVAVADRDMARARAVAEHIGDAALAVQLDVTDPAQWATARSVIETALGPVDIICSNAGVGFGGAIAEISLDAWRWVYEVNVMGALRALQTFLPGMKARGAGGHVLLTSSISALYPFATHAAYTSSKAALLNMATALQMELAGTGIGVSTLCPGPVATNLTANAQEARPADLHATDTGLPKRRLSEQGMAPQVVAQVAIAAMRDDRFFVFTHPDYYPAIRQDLDYMLEAMKIPPDPSYQAPAISVPPIAR